MPQSKSHYSDVIIARWCLKSPASRLIAHPFVQVRDKEKKSKLCVTGLCQRNSSSVTGRFFHKGPVMRKLLALVTSS